jgi:hypothetical protein
MIGNQSVYLDLNGTTLSAEARAASTCRHPCGISFKVMAVARGLTHPWGDPWRGFHHKRL